MPRRQRLSSSSKYRELAVKRQKRLAAKRQKKLAQDQVLADAPTEVDRQGSPERHHQLQPGKKILAKTKADQLVEINYDHVPPETSEVSRAKKILQMVQKSRGGGKDTLTGWKPKYESTKGLSEEAAFCKITERARIRWDMEVAKNAMHLKREIESEEIIPDDINHMIEREMHVKEELENMKKMKRLADKMNILRSLKIESRALELDVLIKTNLLLKKANCDKCLLLMDELFQLSITPLMLKKHPELVKTMKQLRKYVGNTEEWNMTVEEKFVFNSKAEKIRTRANYIYNKFETFFIVPEGRRFWNVFEDEVTEFHNATQDMKKEELFLLMIDPTCH